MIAIVLSHVPENGLELKFTCVPDGLSLQWSLCHRSSRTTMSTAYDQVLGPEYQTLFDPDTCIRKGLCPVTRIRSQSGPLESHSLYYEQHGTGPEKVVFIMG